MSRGQSRGPSRGPACSARRGAASIDKRSPWRAPTGRATPAPHRTRLLKECQAEPSRETKDRTEDRYIFIWALGLVRTSFFFSLSSDSSARPRSFGRAAHSDVYRIPFASLVMPWCPQSTPSHTPTPESSTGLRYVFCIPYARRPCTRVQKASPPSSGQDRRGVTYFMKAMKAAPVDALLCWQSWGPGQILPPSTEHLLCLASPAPPRPPATFSRLSTTMPGIGTRSSSPSPRTSHHVAGGVAGGGSG